MAEIDVARWVPGAVVWSDLPRDYVAAYLKHELNLELGDTPLGATFKEMFNNSTPEGKAKLAQRLGLDAGAAKKQPQYELTAEQQKQVENDILQNCPVKVLAAEMLKSNAALETFIARFTEDEARPILAQLTEKQGAVEILTLACGGVADEDQDDEQYEEEEDEENRAAPRRPFSESCLQLIEDTPALANAFKRIVLQWTHDQWDIYTRIGWFTKYAKRNKLQLVNMPEKGAPWAPTWEQFEQVLRYRAIKNGRPQNMEEAYTEQ